MKEHEVKPSGRRYRVIKQMPWIEGGGLVPPGIWEGGEVVVYEPGDTVYMEDQDVASKYHHLEALDDAGRAILEKAQPKAKVTAVAHFTQNDVEFLTRALDEKRRLYGCVPEYADNRDGSKKLLRYVATKPLPGVVHGDDGLPDSYETALREERMELERKAQEQRSRGQRNARANARRKAARDQAIAAYAVQLANSSDELADNPKRLADVVLQRWKDEWGDPLAPSTVRRILKEQHVASTLRRR